MSDLYIWTVILGLAGLTYLNRISFLVLLAGRTVPGWIQRALGFVPSAVLPALIAPMVLFDRDSGGFNPPVVWMAALAALAVGIATRHLLLTIVVGMGSYHVFGVIW